MIQRPYRTRALVGGLVAILALGPLGASESSARRRRGGSAAAAAAALNPIADREKITQEEIDREMEPGRLIFDTSYRRRFLSVRSVLQQTMDNRYSQKMVEEVARLFETPCYRDVTVQLDCRRPQIMGIDPATRREGIEIDVTDGPPIDLIPEVGGESGVPSGSIDPGPGSSIDLDPTGTGGDTDIVSGTAPPPDLDPTGGIGTTPGVGGITPPDGMTQSEWEALARDLENGIHNEILRVLRARGHEVAALNVFAQSMDLVKVILIVATRDLPNQRIRSTLKDIRELIEREVLAAKYPGVNLAELSSFTLLNEREGHFYEHPVLYWQMQQGWTGAPTSPGAIAGGAPLEGGVSASGDQFEDYFNSGEFVPEEDFDDRDFLEPLDGM